MPIDDELVGREGIASVRVTAETTASAFGNPGVHVFATPALVALFERAAIDALADHLGAGEATVGSILRVTHRAPTPIGAKITARARVRAVEDGKVWFDLNARDDAEPVGDGEHLRIVVDEARFQRRVERKAAALGAAPAGHGADHHGDPR